VSIGIRQVNRGLAQVLWPALRTHGFDERTQRTAWRHRHDGVDVIEIQSIGASFDSVGCTSFSFTAYAAAQVYWAIPPDYQPEDKVHNRPHYWHCNPFVRPLDKTLDQPWFKPFTRPLETLTEPMRIHTQALKRVLRTDVHDRPDVWFVLEDGSNLEQVIEDLVAIVRDKGLPILERFHDPEQVLQMAASGDLNSGPSAPVTQQVVHAALAQLGRR
jgi:hypothetical protein